VILRPGVSCAGAVLEIFPVGGSVALTPNSTTGCSVCLLKANTQLIRRVWPLRHVANGPLWVEMDRNRGTKCQILSTRRGSINGARHQRDVGSWTQSALG
jgi:hypothetical protein